MPKLADEPPVSCRQQRRSPRRDWHAPPLLRCAAGPVAQPAAKRASPRGQQLCALAAPPPRQACRCGRAACRPTSGKLRMCHTGWPAWYTLRLRRSSREVACSSRCPAHAPSFLMRRTYESKGSSSSLHAAQVRSGCRWGGEHEVGAARGGPEAAPVLWGRHAAGSAGLLLQPGSTRQTGPQGRRKRACPMHTRAHPGWPECSLRALPAAQWVCQRLPCRATKLRVARGHGLRDGCAAWGSHERAALT